jgi:uncharacterized membrane protein
MNQNEPVLNRIKNLSWRKSNCWFWISLIIWMLGIGGSDLYAVPALIGLILLFKELILNNDPLPFSSISFNHSIVKILYVLLIFMVLAKTLLSLYSFKWNIYDVGSYSSVVFNLSNGLNFNSFLQVPATADHFTPSLALFVPFYWITATVHWLTFAKALSYLSAPLVVYFWLNNKTEKDYCFAISCMFGLWMLLLYKPSVSSRFFEFSPSSLAPPFIILSFFLMEKKRWFLFSITMLFILGLKEHMGVVLTGFGLYRILQKNFRTGIIFTTIGLCVTYIMIFHLMPYFRDYQVFGNTQIAPFQDITGKAVYIVKLLWPLGFLPLIFWRYGVLAAPAIGVNLISGRPGMYSTTYHYDDISSTLLLMSCALILIEKRTILVNLLERKWLKGVFILIIIGLIAQLPASPIRKLSYAVPDSLHLKLIEDIWSFAKSHPNDSLAVQTTVGPHIHRQNITIMTQQQTGECSPPRVNKGPVKFILLSQDVGHYMINNIENCINFLEEHPAFKRLSNFQHLIVYERSAI